MPPHHRPALPAPGPGLFVSFKDATEIVRSRGRNRSVLDGVNLHIRVGEFVGIIGASGSGKSTLVRALAGLTRLTAGEIRLAGDTVSADRLRTDQRIAYLPQDVIVHETLSPAVTLEYALRLRGLSQSGRTPVEQVREALDRVGLADHADVPIARLSGGQRKRVALAIELLGDPGLILLDEATSGLDPVTEVDMMDLFRSLADEGRTVVCVTHTPTRLYLCDRLVVMTEGARVFHGPPVEAPRFFGVQAIEDIYSAVATRSVDEWRKRFTAAYPGRSFPPLDQPAESQESASSPPPPLTQAAILTAG